MEHLCFIFNPIKMFSISPTLRAMIFRRLCTPKRNNDTMYRLILFEAQIHSKSHGPMRSFKLYSVLSVDKTVGREAGVLEQVAEQVFVEFLGFGGIDALEQGGQ